MVSIHADLIKELRAMTGVGMSKCKEALQASSGDLQEAVNYLRKKGMASGAKKEGRETKEGRIVFSEDASALVLVEINAETDFVVENKKFQDFAKDVAEQALASRPVSLEAFLQENYAKDPSITIDQSRNLVIQTLGENIQIKRLSIVEKKPGTSLGIYSHMGGKIVSMVEITGSEQQKDLAKEISMHVAAYHPEFLKEEEVPEEIQEREKDIARSQMQGKPENIIENILKGKLKAFYAENCLIQQKYVKDPTKTVEQFVREEGKKQGETLYVSEFWRWTVG
ncbi:MAG: translation elongation factor Ts [Chlamydiota bacterium]